MKVKYESLSRPADQSKSSWGDAAGYRRACTAGSADHDAHSQFDQNAPNEQILAVIKQAGVSHVFLSGRTGEDVESRALAQAQPDLISALVASKWDHYQRGRGFAQSFMLGADNPAFASMDVGRQDRGTTREDHHHHL